METPELPHSNTLETPQSEALEPQSPAQTLEPMPKTAETAIVSTFEMGDFVWARKKEQWWPARICDPGKADAKREIFDDSMIFVSYIGTSNCSDFCKITELKPFVDNFVVLSGSSKSKTFVTAVNCAVVEFGKVLEANTTCSCLNDAEKRKIEKFSCNSSNINNFPKKDFLSLVKDVSLDVCVVNGVESVKLQSWVISFERYLSINSCHSRKKHSELVDKIDLNVASDDYSSVRGRKKKVSVMDEHSNLNTSETHVVDEAKKEGYNIEEEIGTTRRERKKSKYLSPPYTYFNIDDANTVDSPRTLTIMQPQTTLDNEEKFNALKDIEGVDVKEALSELKLFAIDNSHLSENPLNTQEKKFILLFREFKYHKILRNSPDILYAEEQIQVAGESGENGNAISNGVKKIERRGRKRKEKPHGAGIVIPLNCIKFNGTNCNSDNTLTAVTPSTSGRKRGRKRKTETSTVLNFANKTVELENNNEGAVVNVPIVSEGSKKQRKMKTVRKEDPAALLLSFLPESSSLSKVELFSKCSSYGPIIEPESEYLQGSCTATIVFAKSSDAEKAFNDNVAALGNPVSSYRLRYLTGAANPPPPVAVPPTPKVSKTSFPDMRNNLAKMISSMTGGGMKPEMGQNLIGEMQGLLSKVDMVLTGPAAAAGSTWPEWLQKSSGSGRDRELES